jgi:hypothetical protein
MKKRKSRWVRIPLSEIKETPVLLKELLEKRRFDSGCWPYRCGDEIKYKQGT